MDIPVLATGRLPLVGQTDAAALAIVPFLQMRDKLFARQACVIHSE